MPDTIHAPIAPRLSTALEALRTCLADHGGACVCCLCAALDGAEAELDALERLAWAVRGRAMKDRAAEPELHDAYWYMVWMEYCQAREEAP